jgi:hypothetical protein
LDAYPRLAADVAHPCIRGKAQIAATLTAKTGAGQEIKHHILGVPRPNPMVLHTQCSKSTI